MAKEGRKSGREEAEEMMRKHGDIESTWRLRFAGTQEWIEGPLSKALLKAAYLTAAYHDVEIADLHGGSTFFLKG